MRAVIEHDLRFEYSRPVFIEPLTARLTPATNAFQQCESFTLEVEPLPRGITRATDPACDVAHTLWFEGVRTTLALRARSVVRTLCENPFDYLVTDAEALRLPVRYASPAAEALAPYLQTSADGETLTRLLDSLRRETGDRTLDFLAEFCGWLHRKLSYARRPEGPPWPAAQTLARGSGSCRDLSVAFIEGCRRVGLAARFVSGYKLEADGDSPNAELHAWAEIFLPGAGWRGYDPSLGLAVADRHIALAAAHDPALAAPTAGAYRGASVRSRLHTRIALKSLSADSCERQLA